MKHVTSIGYRRPRESGGPGQPFEPCGPWVPAFAGMTDKRLILRKSLWFGLLESLEVASLPWRNNLPSELKNQLGRHAKSAKSKCSVLKINLKGCKNVKDPSFSSLSSVEAKASYWIDIYQQVITATITIHMQKAR